MFNGEIISSSICYRYNFVLSFLLSLFDFTIKYMYVYLFSIFLNMLKNIKSNITLCYWFITLVDLSDISKRLVFWDLISLPTNYASALKYFVLAIKLAIKIWKSTWIDLSRVFVAFVSSITYILFEVVSQDCLQDVQKPWAVVKQSCDLQLLLSVFRSKSNRGTLMFWAVILSVERFQKTSDTYWKLLIV